MMKKSGIISIVLFIFAMGLQGCATPARQPAVPLGMEDEAQVPGLPDVRYRIGFDKDMEAMAKEGIEAYKREQEQFAKAGHTGNLPPAVFLTISGGGDNGAFGAGLLNGWTAAGDRP